MIKIEKEKFEKFCNGCKNEEKNDSYKIYIGWTEKSGQQINLCEDCLILLKGKIERELNEI